MAEGGAKPVNPLAGLLALKQAQKAAQSSPLQADGAIQKSQDPKKEGLNGGGSNAPGTNSTSPPKAKPKPFPKITTEQFLNNV